MKLRNFNMAASKCTEVAEEEPEEADIAARNKARKTPPLLSPITIFEKEKIP